MRVGHSFDAGGGLTVPVVESEAARLQCPSGLHLFHNGLSNCSQRVRIVLEEKSIPWESHHIDLMRLEHLSPGYQAIHPKGVVPALVHDGVLVIESLDIIRYLDQRFPDPPLFDSDGIDTACVDSVMELCDSVQRDIKTVTYERLFKGRMPVDEKSMAAYRTQQRNRDLVKFREDFAAGFPRERVENSETRLREWCEKLEQLLSNGSDYIAGEQLSLADVATIPNAHRLQLVGLGLSDFPGLGDWYGRQIERRSIRRSVVDFENSF